MTPATGSAVHWEELRPYVCAHPEVMFVLIHFSLRYTDAEVLAFFRTEAATHGLRNIRPWLTDLDMDDPANSVFA